jgi:hypothetical protein
VWRFIPPQISQYPAESASSTRVEDDHIITEHHSAAAVRKASPTFAVLKTHLPKYISNLKRGKEAVFNIHAGMWRIYARDGKICRGCFD